MNKNAVRIVSALLAISMTLPIAACNKKKSEKRSGKKITADTPWFDCSSFAVEPPVDRSRNLMVLEQSILDYDAERLLVRTNGRYEIPVNEADLISWNSHDYDIDSVTIIDRGTNKPVRNIDLREGLGSTDSIERVSVSNGNIEIVFTRTVETEPDCFESTSYMKTINTDSGAEVSVTENVPDFESDILKYKLGTYYIEAKFFFVEITETSGYYLSVTAPDGNTNVVELKEDRHYIDYINFIVLENESTALISATTDSELSFYKLDLRSLTITRADSKDYIWIFENTHTLELVGSDGSFYCGTKTGIYKVNFAAKRLDELFNYNNCGINRDLFADLNLIDVNGDSFVYVLRPGAFGQFNDDPVLKSIEVFRFTKAGKNPHEGKTVLELYAGSNYISQYVGDVVAEFNDTNGKYFIEYTYRYDQSEAEAMEATSMDESTMARLNINTRQSSQLAADIVNGDGPDILINTAYLNQLNGGKYLADLTPYIGTLDQSKYFTNVLDAFKVDGKLYNLPIDFAINGIQTKHDFNVSSGIGFTTAEYEKFLNEKLNGNDVLVNGQVFYFAMLFNAMHDKFIVNGNADFTCPEFAELARFVNDNVHQRSVEENDLTEDEFIEIGTNYTTCYGPKDYLYYSVLFGNANRFLGIPSTDGRGPSVSANTSVAVSANALDVEACGEFVKLFMSVEMQDKIATDGHFVLSREAFKKSAAAALEYTNSERFYYANNDRFYDAYRITVPDKSIDDLEKIILSCSHKDSADSEISIILIEEMPAYFLGQKDLDSVIKVAQNRVQKVLDERK